MSRWIACLLLFCVSFPCEAKEKKKHHLTSITLVDRNGFSETISLQERLETFERVNFLTPQPYQKVMRVYSRDPLGNIPSFITTYYDNGQIKEYLEVKNSRAHGLYQEWFLTGQVKLYACVIGGKADVDPTAQASWLFDGPSCAYNEEGVLVAKVYYKKGELDGISSYYFADGQLKMSVPYHKGKLEGELTQYYPNGNLQRNALFQKGLPDGFSKTYWPQGALAATEWFDQGRLVQGEYFNDQNDVVDRVEEGCGKKWVLQQGRLHTIQEVSDGVPYGKVWLYNEKGVIEATYYLKDQKKHGVETLFYPNEKPKLTIDWYDEKIQGVVKTWYPTGQQESVREFAQNKKQGHATAWYKNGDLMLIEEYDNDKLVRGQYFKKGEKSPLSSVNQGRGIVTLFDKEGLFSQKISYENGEPVLD